MSGDLTPYLVLAALTVAALAYKGLLPNPLRRPSKPVAPPTPRDVSQPVQVNASPLADLERFDSHTLAVAFAKAARREAEELLAHQVAADAGAKIKATFTAPFSEGPAPAEGP